MQLTINEELRISNQEQVRIAQKKRIVLFLCKVRDGAVFIASLGFIFYLCFSIDG